MICARTGPLHERAERAGDLGCKGRDVRRLIGRLHPASLDAAKVEQRVHQLAQAHCVAALADHLRGDLVDGRSLNRVEGRFGVSLSRCWIAACANWIKGSARS